MMSDRTVDFWCLTWSGCDHFLLRYWHCTQEGLHRSFCRRTSVPDAAAPHCIASARNPNRCGSSIERYTFLRNATRQNALGTLLCNRSQMPLVLRALWCTNDRYPRSQNRILTLPLPQNSLPRSVSTRCSLTYTPRASQDAVLAIAPKN